MTRLPTLDICPPALLEITLTPKDGRAGGRSAESLELKSQSTTGDGNKQQCKPIWWDMKCGGRGEALPVTLPGSQVEHSVAQQGNTS